MKTELINFLFLKNNILEIWLVFSIVVVSFILLFITKFNTVDFTLTKINYYIYIFLIAFFISLRHWFMGFYNFFMTCENFSISRIRFLVMDKDLLILFSPNIDFLYNVKIFFLILSIMFWVILKIFVKLNYKTLDYSVLVLLSYAILGLFLVFSAKDLIFLYLSIELYSLAIYSLLFIFDYTTLNSSIKYFTIGAVSSLFLLFSISIIFFYTGTFDIESLKLFLYSFNYLDLNTEEAIFTKNIFFIFGISLFLFSFILKLGLAPFHAWAIDVYSTQPFYFTSFLMVLPKFVFINFLINFFCIQFYSFFINSILYTIIVTVSLISLVVGTFGVLNQTDIKKIFLYSSLSNIIFLLMPLINPSIEVLSNYFVFIFFYFLNLVGILIVFISLPDWTNLIAPKRIDSLAGLYKSHPYLSVFFAIMLLSFSGFPPFIGFFTKFYFLQTLFSFSLPLSFVLIVSNFITLYYSVKILKLIFFSSSSRIPFYINITQNTAYLLFGMSVILNVISVFYLPLIYSFSYFIVYLI